LDDFKRMVESEKLILKILVMYNVITFLYIFDKLVYFLIPLNWAPKWLGIPVFKHPEQ